VCLLEPPRVSVAGRGLASALCGPGASLSVPLFRSADRGSFQFFHLIFRPRILPRGSRPDTRVLAFRSCATNLTGFRNFAPAPTNQWHLSLLPRQLRAPLVNAFDTFPRTTARPNFLHNLAKCISRTYRLVHPLCPPPPQPLSLA
jgi:hypothetical protein